MLRYFNLFKKYNNTMIRSIIASDGSNVEYYIKNNLDKLKVNFFFPHPLGIYGNTILRNFIFEIRGVEIGSDINKEIDKLFEKAKDFYKIDTIFHSTHPNLDISCLWSKVHDIECSAEFFKGCKNVLDVGSGIGKFVLLASEFNKDTKFTGVEVYPVYYEVAKELQKRYPGNNDFINTDFCNIDMSEYDGAYIFNPFVMSREFQDSGKSKQHFIDSINKMKYGSKLVMNINIFDINHTDFKFVKRMGALYFFTKTK
jgi:hypothetical protein